MTKPAKHKPKSQQSMADILRDRLARAVASDPVLADLRELEPQLKVYQPKTGAVCGCKRGIERDNCPQCEGTGMVIDFRAIHRAREEREANEYIYECQQCGKWNVSKVCQNDNGIDDDNEKGCGETVNLKRIRRWQ